MSNQLQITGEAKIRAIQGPVVANSGVITALDGDASEYVRGDGTLADFPTSTGGGSSVSYYLNTSVSQGTIGGVAYKQLSKIPISGAGTDITTSANGYIASYITDANDPALLEVPAGNFNCEFYFSVNSNSHNPYVYAEVYKYDGTTFTLLGSNVSIPQYLSNGTTLSPYYFAIAVSTAVLTVTDRIAIRIYVNVDGRTVTLHTENNHLCQVVTTFSKGLISLNNLTRQNQFFQTGTSGTDFAISSATATHTFNLPVASAANTGKLSSSDWSTFNGKVPYTGATGSVDLGAYGLTAAGVIANNFYGVGNGVQGGYIYLKQGTTPYAGLLGSNGISADGTKFLLIANVDASNNKIALFELGSLTNNTNRTYTLPDANGTLALLESTQTFTGANTFSGLSSFTFSSGTRMDYGPYLTKGSVPTVFSGSTTNIYSDVTTNNIVIRDTSSIAKLLFDNSTQTYTFPAATGTIALTSDLSGYVTLATTQTISGAKTFGSSVSINTGGQASLSILSSSGNSALIFGYVNNILKGTIDISATEFKLISAIDNILKFQSSTNFRASLIFSSTADYSYTYPSATGTLALTSNLSAYLPLSGGTLTGALSGTSATFSSSVTAQGAKSQFIADGGSSAGAGISLNTQLSGTDRRNWYIGTEENVSGDFAIKCSTAAGGSGNAGNTRISILNSGNVGIGTNSPSGLTSALALNMYAASGVRSQFIVESNAGGNFVSLVSGLNGTDLGALIYNLGMRFGVATNKDATGFVEAMRITSGGNVLIGTTSDDARLTIQPSGSGYGQVINHTNAGSQFFISFRYNGSQIGSITGNNTITSYNVSSDYRLKQDLKDFNGLDLISKIKTYDYEWKSDKSRMYGVVAHELQEVIPYAVNGQKDGKEMQGVDYSKIVPLLVKAIQEQQAIITSLQEQINELKNK